MSELSASPSTTPTVFDPATIEARLNALVGNPDSDSAPEPNDIPELQDQFLADDSLNYLGSRTTTLDENCEPFDTLLEYHRVRLEPMQTRAILHLGFRPDFSLAPSVEATLIDANGRVRITSSSVFGARIEITLTQPENEPTTICIETICTNCSSD